jgi:type III pantothenate kinase
MPVFVDVGNTSLHFASWRAGRVVSLGRLPTMFAAEEPIKGVLRPFAGEDIYVCSVVPAVTAIFEKLKFNRSSKIWIVGKDLNIPVKSLYEPKQIGMDRLVGALACLNLYPASRIIIDFGTAMTFDFMSATGDYQGGFIMPGIGSSLKVLSGCALLPSRITLRHKKALIPRNTSDSISRGIEESFSLMINALAAKYFRIFRIPAKSPIVITGGDGRFIMGRLDFPYVFDELLVLKGLAILAGLKVH